MLNVHGAHRGTGVSDEFKKIFVALRVILLTAAAGVAPATAILHR
jgi:hypothetical protein